jgi:hypothetical protein
MNENRVPFSTLKRWIPSTLSQEQRLALRRRLCEPLGFIFRRDLCRLATIYGTDKWGAHWYAKHYEKHLRALRRKKIILLEIGVGGEQNTQAGGGSLRMWRRYFAKGQIIGLDLYDKSLHAEKRIHIYRGDQTDEAVLKQIVADFGRPDVIIDDGSHINRHVIKTFELLFPVLADDGVYAIEDTQTAYWPGDFGGTDDVSSGVPTSMALLKSLVDGLNYEEFVRPGYVPTFYDRNITALHFYHNLVVVQKGRNQEGSNVIRNNAPPAPAV